MKTKELFKRLNEMGWEEVRMKGSHHLFKHPKGIRTLPVAVHGKEISEVIAKGIIKQAIDALPKEN